MKLGLRLPQRIGADLRTDITFAACTAEAAGFDSLWAWERLLFPLTPLNSPAPGGPWPDIYRQAADPLAVLTVPPGHLLLQTVSVRPGVPSRWRTSFCVAAGSMSNRRSSRMPSR